MTVTKPRDLEDVYRERLAAADPGDTLMTALNDVISTMAPYSHETGDLRPSEVAWLDELAGEAAQAAKDAALAAIADVYARELERLLPSSNDPAVPAGLWEQAGDTIQRDAEAALA